jgi:hypothetical protein
MDLNFPVFATGVRILRASNDVGPLFLGPESTRILEINIHLFISSIYSIYMYLIVSDFGWILIDLFVYLYVIFCSNLYETLN